MHTGKKVMVDTGGASRGGFDARKGQHEFSWRDAMDIPVRWRQLSEPNDQVKLLPFIAGTGSFMPGCWHSQSHARLFTQAVSCMAVGIGSHMPGCWHRQTHPCVANRLLIVYGLLLLPELPL